jgi:hypothetical protein
VRPRSRALKLLDVAGRERKEEAKPFARPH